MQSNLKKLTAVWKALGFPDQQGVSCRNLHEPYHLWTYPGPTWKMKNMEMGLSKLPSWATAQVQDRCIQDKAFALNNLSALNTTTKKQTLESVLRLLQDLPQDNHCRASPTGRTEVLGHSRSIRPRKSQRPCSVSGLIHYYGCKF